IVPSGRCPLYIAADRVRTMFAKMRNDLHEQHARHTAEMDNLYRQLDQCQAELAELRAVVVARQQAEAELAELRRQRTVLQPWQSERDLSGPLQCPTPTSSSPAACNACSPAQPWPNAKQPDSWSFRFQYSPMQS